MEMLAGQVNFRGSLPCFVTYVSPCTCSRRQHCHGKEISGTTSGMHSRFGNEQNIQDQLKLRISLQIHEMSWTERDDQDFFSIMR